MKLTLKQEKFCQKYVELGNASDAYRESYNAGKMKTATIHRKACEVLQNGNVSARVKELQARVQEKHDITVESLLIELEEARTAALNGDRVQTAAAVSATLGKAKLCGLLVDRKESKVSAKVEGQVTLEDIFDGD